MNKKISTLMMAGLLGAGPLCGSAWAQKDVTINGYAISAVSDPDRAKDESWKEGPYLIIADMGTKGVSKDDIILTVTKNTDGTLNYQGKKLRNDNNIDLETATWSFIEEAIAGGTPNNPTTAGYAYSLRNKGTNLFLTFDASGKIITDPNKSSHNPDKGQLTKFSAKEYDFTPYFENGKPLFGVGANAFGFSVGAITTVNGATTTPANYNLMLCTLEKKGMDPKDVAALNDTKGGAGFNLDFSVDNKLPWKNNILDGLDLKAFYVSNITPLDDDASLEIPEGIYFATSYPAELNNEDVITDASLFKQCTFLAIDPEGNYDINAADRTSGLGYELKEADAATMNYFNGAATSDDFSAGSEVYVGNACFTIEISDPISKPDAFTIKVEDFHGFVTEDNNAKKLHKAMGPQYIGVINDQKENYLVTNTTGLSFSATNTTVMKADALIEAFLNTENVASIYTIRFVSGESKEGATEFEQYLTVMKDATSGYAWASTVEYNETDPVYQFVVTAIDQTNNNITFTNRQTKEDFKVQLYENEDGVYTVYPVASNEEVAVEWYDKDAGNNEEQNEKVTFENTVDLLRTQIVLTPCTNVDKYATFVNRTDDMGLVQFELAISQVSGTAFYIGGEQTLTNGILSGTLNPNGGPIKAYTDADNMTQFELIKSEKPLAVVNKYIYLNDKRIVTGGNDSVAYYSYKVKVFDPESEDQGLYLGYNNGYKLVKATKSSATPFIIKNNVDGSVSLIYNADLNVAHAGLEYAEVADVKTDNATAWKATPFYTLSSKINQGLKTFLVEETPAVSWEAVPQHVSFQAVPGGFLTKDENNDARLAIKEEASEDLTFWLDTVKTDRQIPSFYITKGGSFLYNAQDSANYYNVRENYRFNLENKKYSSNPVAKLIFKTGELVSSDTLRTIINNEPTLIAEKDNYPKKVLGGLNDFQFQIILAEDADDEYVIRQNNKYVCQYNNFFYLTDKKDEAYRFIIEKQNAPTANDEITTSEVKVIAGNGQITINGAAGKKVVVSNILGQVVANTVITSDNATIAAPQGIVVVAVEGEEAVKAIVK